MTDYAKCPRCSSPVFDNRPDKALGLHPKRPDLKCGSPTCNWAVWLDSGKATAHRLVASPTPGRADGLPPDCGTCGEPWDWHPVWLWKQREDGGRGLEPRRGQRYLIRHDEGRPCARFNAAHPWGDGEAPASRAAPPASPVDEVKARWRDALQRIADEQKARAA